MKMMPTYRFSEKPRHISHLGATRSAFTLTELAIVLAIVGLLLGGIWAAASAVYANNKVKTAAENTAFVVNNYKSLYGMHGVDVSVDVTCTGAKDDFFPPTMGGKSCSTGTASSYPTDPWGGSVSVTATAHVGLTVSLSGLPVDACIRYASQLPDTSDVLAVFINASADLLPMPITPVTAAANCAGGDTVKVQYRVP